MVTHSDSTRGRGLSPGASSHPWLSDIAPGRCRLVRLFCFPHAGGGASDYRSWADALGADVDVCPVQLPGRENRAAEPAFCELLPLLDALVAAFESEWRRPFALFGHSMGALIAFELARELRRRADASPVHLFVSGRSAPRHRDPPRAVHALPEAEFAERLRELKGTPARILENQEMREVFFPVLRADFALCERYRYREAPPLECPITVLGGSRDDDRPPDLLQEWQQETSGSFTLHMFPGDHFFLRTARQAVLTVVAQELGASVRRHSIELRP